MVRIWCNVLWKVQISFRILKWFSQSFAIKSLQKLHNDDLCSFNLWKTSEYFFFKFSIFSPFFVFFICNKNLPLQYGSNMSQSVKCWNRVINALRPLFWDHLRNLNITYIFHYDVLSNLSPTVTYNTLEFPYNKTFNQMN